MAEGEVRVVALDADDLMHANTGEENYNESAYYNFFDTRQRMGGFVRIGNRPNEGYAEMTVCLYLPDGRVAFMFQRPKIADNSCFDAGGLRFTVAEPMRRHAIAYDGSAIVMERPLDLIDPRQAFTSNPMRPVTIALDYAGLSPVYGGEPRRRENGGWASIAAEKSGQEFARGHLEQHGHARGTVTIDGARFDVDGFGLRDHSWGPRYWQAPKYYRWLTMNFGADDGLVGALTVQRDGTQLQGGYIYHAGAPNRHLGKVEVDTEFEGPEQLHARLTARLHPADGGPVETVTGRVLTMVPLRNRRGGTTTRIAEGLTEWRWGERTGYGWSEYLDHTE